MFSKFAENIAPERPVDDHLFMRRRLFVSGAIVGIAIAGTLFIAWKAFVPTITDLPDFTLIQARTPWSWQRIELQVPATIDRSRPIKLIIYCHGHNERVNGPRADPLKRVLVESLRDAGYVIASSNAHGNAWGNPASVRDYCALYTYVAKRYRVGDVYLLSQSMGGLPGLNVLASHAIPNVRAWVGICPVCNLRDMASGKYSSSIHDAFPAGIPADSDPCEQRPEQFNVPMLAFATKSDTVVPRAQNVDALAARLAAGQLRIVNCMGDHADSTQFQPDVILDFFSGL